MTPGKERADALLVRSGLAEDETEARALIMAGRVLATDPKGRERRIDKPGESLEVGMSFRVRGKDHPYVSRGGVKLSHALDELEVDPRGRICADIGVSTGGFTDCLLQRGAERVHAIEVGHNQTAWKIRTDPRVQLYEKTHARHLTPAAFGELVDLMVIDVSFIGLAQIWLALVGQLAPGASVVALVKPQFELPREDVGEGGIVASDSARARAVQLAVDSAAAAGLRFIAQTPSPIRGADGNIEQLIHLRLGEGP